MRPWLLADAGRRGSGVVILWHYRVAHRACRRRNACQESGCDRHFRSCRILRTSFAGIPGAPRSRLRFVSAGNGAGGDYDRRIGAGSGIQRGRRGPGLSSAARRSGAGSDRGDARAPIRRSRRRGWPTSCARMACAAVSRSAMRIMYSAFARCWSTKACKWSWRPGQSRVRVTCGIGSGR
jgi:hypothetical protein